MLVDGQTTSSDGPLLDDALFPLYEWIKLPKFISRKLEVPIDIRDMHPPTRHGSPLKDRCPVGKGPRWRKVHIVGPMKVL